MKRLIIFLLILFAIGFGIWYYQQQLARNHNQNELVLYGNVDIRQVDISFRVEGRVKELFFEEGDLVSPGDLMATLDPEPYEDIVRQNRAQIASAKAAYENAEILYNRRIELKESGAISQEDFDDALSTWKTSLANLDLAKASLETSQTNLKDTQVFAPTEGWILTRIREPGSVVRVSDPVFTESIKSPVWVRAYVNEPQLGMIYPGMVGQVFTDSSGKSYQGTIGFISPVAEFTPKTVETTQLRTDLVYRLRLYVDNPDQGLRQGMPVTVKLALKEKDA